MKIIFDWVNSFNEKKENWKNDAEIIFLEITHTECCFAKAKVLIASNKIKEIETKKYAKIAYMKDENDTPIELFTGKLVSFPMHFTKSCIELELISEPNDYKSQLENFIKLHKEKNTNNTHEQILNQTDFYLDPLFYSEQDLNNPTAYLESGNYVFLWDKANGIMNLSCVTEEKNHIEISTDDIIEHSMKTKLLREPIQAINICLNTSWKQNLFQIFNIMPQIAQVFPEKIINSFFKLNEVFKKIINIMKEKGFILLKNTIKEINPNEENITNNFKLTSNIISLLNKKKIKFKKFFYEGMLIFAAKYNKKRREKINVTIKSANIDELSSSGVTKTINIHLNDIQLSKPCPIWEPYAYYYLDDEVIFKEHIYKSKHNHNSSKDFDETMWNKIKILPDALKNHSSASFFSTIRGKNAIMYAMERAIANIMFSRRDKEISFCVDANKYMHISLGDSIIIKHAQFQNREIKGKVIKVQFKCNHLQKYLFITLGVISNTLEVYENDNNHFQNIKKKLRIYIENLDIMKYSSINDSQNKTEFIKNISVENNAHQQEEILNNHQFKSMKTAMLELKKHPTKIKLRLENINTTKELINTFNLPTFTI